MEKWIEEVMLTIQTVTAEIEVKLEAKFRPEKHESYQVSKVV